MLGDLRRAPLAVIPNGQSLSNAVDLGEGGIVAIVMPSSWTTANLTFAASEDYSGTYLPIYDSSGTELTITTGSNRYILLPPASFAGIRFLKIRSGTLASAVNQGAARSLIPMVRELA